MDRDISDAKILAAKEDWRIFIKESEHLQVSFPNFIRIPIWPDDPEFCRIIIMLDKFRYQRILKECEKYFKVSSPYEDLDVETYNRNDRNPNRGAYGVFIRNRFPADVENNWKSKRDMMSEGQESLTLMEYLVLHLKVLKETGKHLDAQKTATLCWTTHFKNGNSPYVYFDKKENTLFIKECQPTFKGLCIQGRNVRARSIYLD